MSDLQARMLLNQVKELKRYRKKKIKIFKQFVSSVVNPKIEVFKKYHFEKDFIYRFILIFINKSHRDKSKKLLNKNKICAQIPIIKFELLHNYLKLEKKNYPNSNKIVQTTLSIPFHNNLTPKEIKYIKYYLKKI